MITTIKQRKIGTRLLKLGWVLLKPSPEYKEKGILSYQPFPSKMRSPSRVSRKTARLQLRDAIKGHSSQRIYKKHGGILL